MNKLKVGQKLYLVTSGRFDRYKEVTVSKVGKKYFYVEEVRNTKFDKVTLSNTSEYGYETYICFLSVKDVEDAIYGRVTLQTLRDFFSGYRTPNVSVDKLRKIDKILFGDEE